MKGTVAAILFQSTDPERLAEFYRRAFDLSEPFRSGDDHVGVQAESLYLGFDKILPETEGGRGVVSVWFNVSHCVEAFEKLRGLGAVPLSNPDTELSPGEILATLLDPDGNVVGLIGPA